MKVFLKLFFTAVCVLIPLVLTVGIALDAAAAIKEHAPIGRDLPDLLTVDIWDGLVVHIPKAWSGALLIQLLLPVWCMFDVFSGRKTDGWNHVKDRWAVLWLLPYIAVAVALLLVLLSSGVPAMLWFLMGSIGYPLLVAGLTSLILFLLVVGGAGVLLAWGVVRSAFRPAKVVQ